jgi:nuclear cap-binding protein subunit 1
MLGQSADPVFRTVEQPLKIPFIAAIVLIANVQKPEFTTEILQKVGNALQKRLETGSWREVKLYLRFLGCLQGLFESEGIFAILEDLFSRAVDLQTQSSEDVSTIYSLTATTS